LKVLPLLFLLWSALGMWANVHRWGPESAFGEVQHWAPAPEESEDSEGDSLSLDWVAFALVAALGLWRCWGAGRGLALLLTWYWWIGSALLIPQVFHLRIGLRSSEPILPGVPEAFLRWAVIPFFLVQLWQYVTLKRADIKALFYPPVRVKLRGMREASAGGELVDESSPTPAPPV
jgi:hypothetical protein